MGHKDHHQEGLYNNSGVKPCQSKKECVEYTFKAGEDGWLTIPCHVHKVCVYAVAGGGGGGGCGKKPVKGECDCDSYEHDGHPGSGGGGGSGEKIWKEICVEPGCTLFFEVGKGGKGGGSCYDPHKKHFGGLDGQKGTNSLVYLNTPPNQCKNPCIVVNARGGCGGKAGTADEEGNAVGGAGGTGYIGGGGGAPFGAGGISHDGEHPNGQDAGETAGGNGGAANGIWGCGSPCGGGGGGGKFGGSGLPRFVKEHIINCPPPPEDTCDEDWSVPQAEWQERHRCCEERTDCCDEEPEHGCCGDWDVDYHDDTEECHHECEPVNPLDTDTHHCRDKKVKSAPSPKICTGSGGGGGSSVCYDQCYGASGADGVIKVRYTIKKKKEKHGCDCH